MAIALSNSIPFSEVTKRDEGRVSGDEGIEQEETEITERDFFLGKLCFLCYLL